jgi:hypothetical protein
VSFADADFNASGPSFESMTLSDASFSFFAGYVDEDVYLGLGGATGARFDTIPSLEGTVFGVGVCVNKDSSQREMVQVAGYSLGSAGRQSSGRGLAPPPPTVSAGQCCGTCST